MGNRLLFRCAITGLGRGGRWSPMQYPDALAGDLELREGLDTLCFPTHFIPASRLTGFLDDEAKANRQRGAVSL